MVFPIPENAVNQTIADMLIKSKETFDTIAQMWTLNYAWVEEPQPVDAPSSGSSNADKRKRSGSKSSKGSKKGKGGKKNSKSSKKGKK